MRIRPDKPETGKSRVSAYPTDAQISQRGSASGWHAEAENTNQAASTKAKNVDSLYGMFVFL